MTTEIYFELQRRRSYATGGLKTPWKTDFKSQKFTEALDEYDWFVKSGYDKDNLQILQIIKTSTVILPEGVLLQVTEVKKD